MHPDLFNDVFGINSSGYACKQGVVDLLALAVEQRWRPKNFETIIAAMAASIGWRHCRKFSLLFVFNLIPPMVAASESQGVALNEWHLVVIAIELGIAHENARLSSWLGDKSATYR